MEKLDALKAYLGEGMAVEESTAANYFETDAGEFLVLDENERMERLLDDIRETASYFNASFLAEMTGLPQIAFEKLVDENEAVVAIIEGTCGLERFAEAAVDADGFGHFISGYDGEEIELDGGYFAYRTN